MSKTQIASILLSDLFNPYAWNDPEPVEQFRKLLESYFKLPAYLVNSGRSAIYVVLKAAGVGIGDEVLIQAYTCNAVSNPIIWLGGKPVYVDINPDTLNVDINDLKRKITTKTKVIILQHTLGRPGPIKEVSEIAKEKDILAIEDCAHSLGAETDEKKLGTSGDAAIFSFARGKVISTVSGGAIVIRNKNLNKKAAGIVSALPNLPKGFLTRDLVNFFTWRALLRRIYFGSFGANLIKFLDGTDFFNVLYSHKELQGKQPEHHPAKMPAPFAKIGLEELPNLTRYNQKRAEISARYRKEVKNKEFRLLQPHSGVYLRFVAFYKDPETFFKKARKERLWFGNWYNAPVYPKETSAEKLGYLPGSCPNAEKAAFTTINLPNYPEMSDQTVGRVIEFINTYQ